MVNSQHEENTLGSSFAQDGMRRWLLLALILAAAGVMALAIDLPVAQICLSEGRAGATKIHLGGDLRKAINLSEVFAHGFGVLFIVLTVFVLDQAGRRTLLRILACSYGSGLLADIIKLLVSRFRPRAFFETHQELSAAGVLDTFNGWLPLLGAGHAGQGTPSAHAATAAGLAVALGWRYPRGRWLFACFAGLAALQRVVIGAHFVSDTFWGAAIGCLLASLCIYGRWPGGMFDRWECR